MNPGSTPVQASLDEQACQIDQVLARGFRWLRFPQPYENRFAQEYLENWRRHEAISAVFALLLFDAFLVTDRQLIPDIFDFVARVRLLVISPLILIGIVMHLRATPVPLRQTYMAVVSVLCACSLMWFQSLTRSPVASYYFMGVPLIVIYTNVVQRLRFWHALCASVATVIICVGWETQVTVVPPVALQGFALVMVTTVALTMIANYRLELGERYKYLLRLRDELQRDRERGLLRQLGAANRRLQQLSNTDPLTGIANRRSFDEHFGSAWDAAQRDGTPLSLLLFDVDFFKLYNDRYGHPAGDQCLRRLAAAAASALRQPGDFIARYGGEEFAAILPQADEALATCIAERLRAAVQAVGMPHADSRAAPVVTVSVGVASTLPARQGMTPQALVDKADALLYRAKLAGRNRVCTPLEDDSPVRRCSAA